MKKYLWIIIIVLAITNTIAVTAWYSGRSHDHVTHALTKERQKYPLLAKRLFLDHPSDVIINFSPLRANLNQYIEKNLPANTSFYFEYLPTGSTIRINSNEELVGASLLKLPAVMDLYKADELGKLSLDQTITLKEEWLDDDFETLYQRGVGATLTLRQAAGYVLRDSDNTALRAIHGTVDPLLGDDQRSLIQLDVPYTVQDQAPAVNQVQAIIGAQSYTSLLKCLYFSCFLGEAHSQNILSLMAEAPTHDRFGAALPANETFAHKIGTFEQKTQSDCGIVYLENRNFAICMLVNMPEEEAKAHFKAVSGLVYEYLSKQN